MLYAQHQPANEVFFIESGLVKVSRVTDDGERLILVVCGPSEIVGEEALCFDEDATYHSKAEVLSSATVHRIPAETFRRVARQNPELASAVFGQLIGSKLAMARKIELLCLRDVEYRMIYHLIELARLVKPEPDGSAYQLPVTQWELADLIGATRETISTALNSLERRGLIKLSRRLLTIGSLNDLTQTSQQKSATAR